MVFFLLACVNAPAPSTSDVLAPLGGGDDDVPVVDGDTGEGDTGGGDDSDTTLPPEDPPPDLVLNEVMTDNGFTLNVDGGYPDWVEIYNRSGETVSLRRVTLTDSSGRVWIGTDGEIAPGGYVLVYCDSRGTGMHAPFSLNSDGDTVTLGVDGWNVDRIATGKLAADVSWARIPDGGDWAPTIWTTAGSTNGDEASPNLDTDALLFGLNGVHPVTLTLDSAAMSSLRSAPTTYVSGSVTLDGSVLDPVGVRLRGSSTMRSIDQKSSFKLDMNRYSQLEYRGQKKMHLLNMIWDPSDVREYMSYDLMRRFGVAAARNAYAWVDVNGTDKGIYLLSEVYDSHFLKAWFGDSDGYLWEASGDLTSVSTWGDCEQGGPCDISVLRPVATLLNGSATDDAVAEMETYLDLDEWLREIAMEKAVGQWDGYCSPHNYRVYWDPHTGLASVLPSSLDLTFDNLGYVDYGEDYFSCGGRLLGWCLENSSCEARYIDIMNELADRIEDGDFEVDETMDTINTLIDSYAVEDESTGVAAGTYAQHLEQFEYVRTALHDEVDDIRAQIAAR